MERVKGEFSDGSLKLILNGRIDSNNAPEVEAAIRDLLEEYEPENVLVEAADLEYISSAGLRVLLHLRKKISSMTIVNVNSEVYEILDMTGFTQMMPVEKAYRVVSVEGCEEIGRGANGRIYRIDQDNVVKVYRDANALEEIQHEREVARLALILGIPTAISYDVVKVGDSYGSVFELLNAKSFSKILANEPDKMDWCVSEYVKMLRRIHDTVVPEGKLPDMRETAISWAEFVQDYLPEAEGKKLVSLMEAIPQDQHMIHGDYHTKNLELQNDEVLLIDMDTLSVGHPVLELGSMFNAFIGFSEIDHDTVRRFQGFDFETSKTFWHKFLESYLGTTYEKKIREVEDKARIVGYTRLIRRSIRRGGLDDEKGRAQIEHWKAELIELLQKTNTLLFARSEMDIEATRENLPCVLSFVNTHLEGADCPEKDKMQICLAVEEIFINIASYAYAPDKGNATVRVEVDDDPVSVAITFVDQGKPYDPLKGKEPDVTLPAEERQIGGLGVFLVKKTMDDVSYEYKDGHNILTLKKNL